MTFFEQGSKRIAADLEQASHAAHRGTLLIRCQNLRHKCRVVHTIRFTGFLGALNKGTFAHAAAVSLLARRVGAEADHIVALTARTQNRMHLNLLNHEANLPRQPMWSHYRIATGEITEIAFTEKPRRACIKFSLSVFDVVNGQLVHGAVSTGYSPPDATGSDDALIELAVKNSVTDAARPGINTVSLPTATILNIRKTAQNTIEVPLNRGTRDGFRLGQVLMVIRGGERTGRVRITTIGPTDSKATAIEGGDKIKPEDQAIGIYEIEGYQ